MAVPQVTGEEALAQYVDVSVDVMRLCDLVRIAGVSTLLRRKAYICMRTLVQKIVISSKKGVNIRIYAANGREVFNRTCPAHIMLTFMKYLNEVGVNPTELDIRNYNHEPRDNILDVLNNFVSCVKKVSMACEKCCNCSEECLRLGKMRLGSVYCISPPALLFTNTPSINELHIDARIPTRCLERLHLHYHFHKSPAEIFEEFRNCLNMLARSLTISEVHTISIKRHHLAALIERMQVEELHLIEGKPEWRPVLMWAGDAGAPRPNPVDLKFAETQTDGAVRTYWNTTDPQMNLLKLFYQSVGGLSCAEVIRKLTAWFSVKKLLEISLPKKKGLSQLMDDLKEIQPLLAAFTGDEIYLKWTCERNHDLSPRYSRICTDITSLYREAGFRVADSKTWENEQWFLLEVSSRNGSKTTLEFSFIVAPEDAVEEEAAEMEVRDAEFMRLLQEEAADRGQRRPAGRGRMLHMGRGRGAPRRRRPQQEPEDVEMEDNEQQIFHFQHPAMGRNAGGIAQHLEAMIDWARGRAFEQAPDRPQHRPLRMARARPLADRPVDEERHAAAEIVLPERVRAFAFLDRVIGEPPQ